MVKLTLKWDTVISNKNLIEKKEYVSQEFSHPCYVLTKLSSKNTDNAELSTADNLSWFRSVVWEQNVDLEKNGGVDADATVRYIPVCVAPPKAWKSENDDTELTGGQVEDFVEGTMVNVFVTSRHSEPQVATRSSLGATGTFYSERSFMELFKDALVTNGKELNTCTFPLGRDETAHFWSFVLAHPENRFVENVKTPTLTLVHEGWVDTDGVVEVVNRPSATSWTLPVKYDCEPTMDAVNERLNALGNVHGLTWQGMVVRLPSGNRIKFVQSGYTRLRSWRQEPKKDARLLWLVRENSKIVAEYMKYFPEDLERFLELNKMIGIIKRELYSEYQSVHIKRVKKLDAAKDFYRPHVFTLHGIYINTLKPKGWFVRTKEISDYVANLPWQRVYYIIRRMEGKINNPVATAVAAAEVSLQVTG